jgi:hypothetical protein
VSGATPGHEIVTVVKAARARLARVAGRQLLLRRGIWVILGAATLGAARPLYYPLDLAAPLWLGAALALGVAAVVAGVGLAALVVVGRGRRPSELAAARTVDEALGLREVVASGFAFDRDRREGPIFDMAIGQAVAAAASFDARRHVALPSLRPRVRRVALAAGLATIVAVLGCYHPALASIMAAPPTEAEMAAANELDRVARELDRAARRAEAAESAKRRPAPERGGAGSGASAGRDQAGKNLAEQARKASAAARRGDRTAALKQIDALGQTGRQASRRSQELTDALRRIAEALEPRAGSTKTAAAGGEERAGESSASKTGESASSGSKTSKSSSVEESLRRLARKLQEPQKSGAEGTAERRRTLESLARAVAESERSAASSQSEAERAAAERLAEALANAGKAAGAGDRAEASRQLEQAIERARQLQATQAELERQAATLAQMLETAGLLGQEMQLALAGQKQGRGAQAGSKMGEGAMMGMGNQGEGQGEGAGAGEKMSSSELGRALALRLAALGMGSPGGDPTGNPGRGREGSANNWRAAPGKAIGVNGGLRARSDVREGDLAVTAIEGLGRSSEPTKAYLDVYPTYAALAEESMADETVPAAQRHVVRRYFEVIRPGGDDAQGAERTNE